MTKVAVVTGASAGVGRATVEEFARQGYDIALLAREPERLQRVARELERRYHIRALAIPTDVAVADAIEKAATRTEEELGPIDVWVNVAMATVFAPVSKLTAQEFERGTRVTYLGQVHGTMAALSRMRLRNRGTIVNVDRRSDIGRCRCNRSIAARNLRFVALPTLCVRKSSTTS